MAAHIEPRKPNGVYGVDPKHSTAHEVIEKYREANQFITVIKPLLPYIIAAVVAIFSAGIVYQKVLTVSAQVETHGKDLTVIKESVATIKGWVESEQRRAAFVPQAQIIQAAPPQAQQIATPAAPTPLPNPTIQKTKRKVQKAPPKKTCAWPFCRW